MTDLPVIVGIRFSRIGKMYYFDASRIEGIRLGDSVVVETSRGWQIGEVIQFVKDTLKTAESSWKPIDRRATPRDLLLRQFWQQKEVDVIAACRQRVKELRVEGIKIIAAEYSFDGQRLVIMFSSESDEKAELKSLRQDMQKRFTPAQVELRQIGPRDVAKFLGGMGACGLEMRCCAQFLTEFSSISIKMAKEQGISLTPAEITGICGRLRCCLIYEYEHYVAARAELPRRNKRVITPKGEGKVVEVFPLRQAVLVELPEAGYREFLKDEIQPADELEALQKRAQNPCPNGENCGKKNIR